MCALPIVQGSLVQTPIGGVKMDGNSLRESALAPGRVAKSVGDSLGSVAEDISQKLQQNFNYSQMANADLTMRKTKDDFTAQLATMPDPGTWLPAWKEQLQGKREAILNDPKNGPDVKRMLTAQFNTWEQATTSEINIQALRKQVADSKEIALADSTYAAHQGDEEGALRSLQLAVDHHAMSAADYKLHASQIPGIAAKSRAFLVVDSDPGNAPELLKKDPSFLKAMGPVVFNSVLGAAHEKQNQLFSNNYNDTREEMRAAGGIDPQALQLKVKNNQITQRMADSLVNLQKQETYQNDKGTFDFARTMVQDHDWENDTKPEDYKRQLLETFPIKNYALQLAFGKSIDAAIGKAKKTADKEEQPVKSQIFAQMREDRTANGYFTPSFDVIQKGDWHLFKPNDPDKTVRTQLLGGLATLHNAKELTDEQITESFGKGVTRADVIKAEQDKYNTVQEKMRQWFDDPKNKDADYEMATSYLRKLEEPYVIPAARETIKANVDKKDEAMAWAMAHPNDPRAIKIKAKLGIK